MNVPVYNWIHDFGIKSLNLTAVVISDSLFVRCPNSRSDLCAPNDRIQGKSENLRLVDFDVPVKLGIPAGKNGTVGFSLAIEYKGIEPPYKSDRVLQGSFTATSSPVSLPFQCTPEGDVRLNRDTKSGGRKPGRTGPAYFPDRTLSVDIGVYSEERETRSPGQPYAGHSDFGVG